MDAKVPRLAPNPEPRVFDETSLSKSRLGSVNNKLTCVFLLILLAFVLHDAYWYFQRPSQSLQKRRKRISDTFEQQSDESTSPPASPREYEAI